MAYKLELLKKLLKEKWAVEGRMRELIRPMVFSKVISVSKIPETKEELLELMEGVLNEDKCPWIDLEIVNISDKNHNLCIFGRKKFILNYLEKIVEMIKIRGYSQMGHVGVFSGGDDFPKYDLDHFFSLFS